MEQRLLCILDKCIFPPPPSNSDGTNAPLLRAAAEPPFRNCPKTVMVMLPSPGFDSYPAPEKPAQGVGLGGTRVRPVSRHFLISGPYISAAARRSGSARTSSRSATSAPDTMSICIDARRAQSTDAAMTRFFSPARGWSRRIRRMSLKDFAWPATWAHVSGSAVRCCRGAG